MNVSKKDKIKAKLAAKKEKLVAKLKGAKVKKATAALAVMVIGLAMCGCQSTPNRAQNQTIKDCTFYVMVPPAVTTNAQASAIGTVGDLFCQNMVVENSGTESLTPTQTVSPTTTLSYGVGGGDSLISLVSSLKSLIYGSGTTTATATPATAGTSGTFTGSTTSACADGDCSD